MCVLIRINTVTFAFPSSLQVLCQSRLRQRWPKGRCLTPGGRRTGTWGQCSPPPETYSGNFTSPSTINWPVYWTTRRSSGITPELAGTQTTCGWTWVKHKNKKSWSGNVCKPRSSYRAETNAPVCWCTWNYMKLWIVYYFFVIFIFFFKRMWW